MGRALRSLDGVDRAPPALRNGRVGGLRVVHTIAGQHAIELGAAHCHLRLPARVACRVPLDTHDRIVAGLIRSSAAISASVSQPS